MKSNFVTILHPIIFLFALFCCIPLQGQFSEIKLETSPIPIDPHVKIGTLPNGFTYYIRKNSEPSEKLELRLVINAGSILENDEQLGLAHFMEHMNFNGTKHFKKNDLVAYLQGIGVQFGADLNAYTGFEETVYILPIPTDTPEKVNQAFQILEDWAHNSTLTEKDIDEERGVVLEELRLRQGAQERLQKVTLPKVMFGSRYPERLPIGTKDNIESFSYEALRQFYTTWYRPDLMALIAVGDLDVQIIEDKIISHFSGLKATKPLKPRPDYELPNHKETLIVNAQDEETVYSQVQIIYKDTSNSKPEKNLQDLRQSLIRRLFTTMINDRLNELARQTNPPFIHGYSLYGSTYSRNKNAYRSNAQTEPKYQLRGFKALLTENERVKRYGFVTSELVRAKKDLLASIQKKYNERNTQKSYRYASNYIAHFLRKKPIPGIKWYYTTTKDLLPYITLEEVNEVIHRFLHEENRVVVFTRPTMADSLQISNKVILDIIEEVKKSKIEPYSDTIAHETLLSHRPKPGKIMTTTHNTILNTTTFVLDNGAKVTYKKTDFKNDQILFSAYSPGGTNYYTLSEYRQTIFANGGLTEAGIGGLSPSDVGKINSGKTVSVRPGIGTYTDSFSGSSAPKDLETLFQMVHLYFTDLNKDQEKFDAFLKKQRATLENIMRNPGMYFSDQIGKIRNEGNPRYIGFPLLQVLDSSNYELAYKKYQERFGDASDFHFFFVGNIEETRLKNLAKTYLGSLPGKQSNEAMVFMDFRPPETYQKHVFHKGKAQQSQVRFYWDKEVTYSKTESMAVEALAEILSVKLIEKLREEEAAVYGVGARGSITKIPYAKFSFRISFPCGPDNVDRLSQITLNIVNQIKKQGVDKEALDHVKQNFLLNWKERKKSNGFWLSHLERTAMLKDDPNAILNFEAELEALKPETIQLTAKKYLDDRYLLTILMPETEITE
jgi:zinc protease